MSFMPKRKVYKVVILGDGGVGKTSLRKRYMGDGFSQNYLATIGADFSLKRLVDDGSRVVQIWDVAGQPRFSDVRKGYYQGTKGALLVYDLTRKDTFYDIPNWISEVMANSNMEDPVPMALVANKVDLRTRDPQFITAEEGKEYAEQLSSWADLEVPYIESSAKTGLNVDQVFQSLIQNIEYREGAKYQGY